MEEAFVSSIKKDGTIIVRLNNGSTCPCSQLRNSILPPVKLNAGDEVFVSVPSEQEDAVRGIVHGKIVSADESLEEDIFIEAAKSIILKAGKTTISLDKNGQLFQKAEKIRSHARKTNHILGASVEVN